MAKTTVLLIEPFYTGSHKQLIDLLHKEVPETELVTLPGKKWHWKARTAALWLSQAIPKEHSFKTLFTSSVLNLAELTALRPDLAGLHKVMYFHENQLVYPVRKQQDRDFQFGYNQILSSLVADVVLFNSKHNLDTFLNNINSHLKLIPDHRPKGLADQIKPKCHVLHFPIVFPSAADILQSDDEAIFEEPDEIKDDYFDKVVDSPEENSTTYAGMNTEAADPLLATDVISESYQRDYERITESVDSNTFVDNGPLFTEKLEGKSYTHDCSKVKVCEGTTVNCHRENRADSIACDEIPMKKLKFMENTGPLHILWPHRWEHDKDPETFFKILIQLHSDGIDFRVSVLGETYSAVPDIFEKSKDMLKEKILHWGFLPSKQHYYRVLKSADCVVSTAKHEFFGVAMLEAVHLGCYPICPNRLVYPEIFPKECLYNTEHQLFKKLREYCRKPYIVRQKGTLIDTGQYTWDALKDQFLKYIVLLL